MSCWTMQRAGGPEGAAKADKRGLAASVSSARENATQLEHRRAGTSTAFVDSASGESILEVGSDENGVVLLFFRLYDAGGQLIAESDGFEHFPDGLTVNCQKGEQLLHVPSDLTAPVQYRLYNSSGRLLTWSDGVRTKIYAQLRMDGVGRGWAPPEGANGASNDHEASRGSSDVAVRR